MDGLFAGARDVTIVPPAVENDAAHRDLLRLLRQEAHEFEVELGAPVRIASAAHKEAASLVMVVEPGVDHPTVELQGNRLLLASGSDLESVVEALSLVRTLRTRRLTKATAEPEDSFETALDVVQHEVATSYPAFRLRGLDWSELSLHHRNEIEPDDPLPGLQRWVASLDDAHTAIHTLPRPQPAPYAAVVARGSLFLADVPAATVAYHAGIRPGDEILGVDVADLWGRCGAPAHLRPWLIGRRVLSASPDRELRLLVRRRDGTTTELTHDRHSPRPEPIEVRRLPSGAGYLRIRRWLTDDEDAIDEALADLRATPRLLVDVRANAGGMLVAATAFRDRFVPRACQLGAISYSTGDGTMSRRFPIEGSPSERARWAGRVRFLTDPLTYSASEDAMLGLSQFEHIDIVGQPSGGGSGRPRTVRVMSSIQLSVSTALTYDHAGRCIEGAGLAVDRVIEPIGGDAAVAEADKQW